MLILRFVTCFLFTIDWYSSTCTRGYEKTCVYSRLINPAELVCSFPIAHTFAISFHAAACILFPRAAGSGSASPFSFNISQIDSLPSTISPISWKVVLLLLPFQFVFKYLVKGATAVPHLGTKPANPVIMLHRCPRHTSTGGLRTSDQVSWVSCFQLVYA